MTCHSVRGAALAGVLVLAAACSDGGSSSTSPSSGTTSSAVYNIAIDTTTTLDSTSAPAGGTLHIRVVVTRSGSPATATSVTWKIGTGHGHVSDSTTTTDPQGYAQVTWTLGDTIGMNTLVAVAGDNSVTVKAVGLAGPPAILARVSGDSLFTIDGATILVTAVVKDALGNPVKGVTIDWLSSDGALSATQSQTGVSGHAENAFTSPSSPGESTVTASLAGKASITFRIGHQ